MVLHPPGFLLALCIRPQAAIFSCESKATKSFAVSVVTPLLCHY